MENSLYFLLLYAKFDFLFLFFSEDYTNTEYLEIDEEDVKEDEEIIPLEFSSMTKVIRVSTTILLSSRSLLNHLKSTEYDYHMYGNIAGPRRSRL